MLRPRPVRATREMAVGSEDLELLLRPGQPLVAEQQPAERFPDRLRLSGGQGDDEPEDQRARPEAHLLVKLTQLLGRRQPPPQEVVGDHHADLEPMFHGYVEHCASRRHHPALILPGHVEHPAGALVVHYPSPATSAAVEVGDMDRRQVQPMVGAIVRQHPAVVGERDAVVVLVRHRLAEQDVTAAGAKVVPDLRLGICALADSRDLPRPAEPSQEVVVVARSDGIATQEQCAGRHQLNDHAPRVGIRAPPCRPWASGWGQNWSRPSLWRIRGHPAGAWRTARHLPVRNWSLPANPL
jgi:hypothetical protein